MPWIHSRTSTELRLSSSEAEASSSRPLPWLTMSCPDPVSSVSSTHGSSFITSGAFTPGRFAALIFSDMVRSSSSVSGKTPGSRPAARSWALLAYIINVETLNAAGHRVPCTVYAAVTAGKSPSRYRPPLSSELWHAEAGTTTPESLMNWRLVSSVKTTSGSWSGVAIISSNFFWSSMVLPWASTSTCTLVCDAL